MKLNQSIKTNHRRGQLAPTSPFPRNSGRLQMRGGRRWGQVWGKLLGLFFPPEPTCGDFPRAPSVPICGAPDARGPFPHLHLTLGLWPPDPCLLFPQLWRALGLPRRGCGCHILCGGQAWSWAGWGGPPWPGPVGSRASGFWDVFQCCMNEKSPAPRPGLCHHRVVIMGAGTQQTVSLRG